MAYTDSDYTVMINTVHWHKCKILVPKLTLVVENMGVFVFLSVAIAQASTLTCFGSIALVEGP